MKFLVGVIFLWVLFPPCFAWQEMVVKTAVADLRALEEKTNMPREVCLDDLMRSHKKNAVLYKDAPSLFCRDNPHLLAQLLFGERVLAEPLSDGWYKVQAVEQKVFRDKEWIGCPGFVAADQLSDVCVDYKTMLVVAKPWAALYKKEEKLHNVMRLLSLGTCLAGVKKVRKWWIVDTPIGAGVVSAADVFVVDETAPLEVDVARARVVENAKLFLGGPYIWGGCSAWKEHASRVPRSLETHITGVDCSSLMSLAFKACGFLIPRNSSSQKLAAGVIEKGEDLRQGDLIFFAETSKKATVINHVVMYCGKNEQGDDIVLESHGRSKPFGVRMVATNDYQRFECKPLSKLHNEQTMQWTLDGKVIHEIIYFGSFFIPEKLAKLRRDLLQARRGVLNS